MTSLEVVGTDVVVIVEGLDKLWALKSELRVPLAHVVSVERAGNEAHKWLHGMRAPGTNIPGVISAGTFYQREGRVFWDVHDANRAIVILLRDDRYAKLIIEVENPDAAIAAVEAALVRAADADV